MKLRLVGYWKEQLDDELPLPQELEKENDPNVREHVATYLDAGTCRIGYRGYSFCRYGCSKQNGSSELTDGRWTWPQGLSHYVRTHAIALPQELVADACASERRALLAAAGAKVESELEVDLSYWIEWARPFRQPRVEGMLVEARATVTRAVERAWEVHAARLQQLRGVGERPCIWAGCGRLALNHSTMCGRCVARQNDTTARSEAEARELRRILEQLR
jgi:hypothetical protein